MSDEYTNIDKQYSEQLDQEIKPKVSKHKQIKILLVEPINYVALACAYRANKWSWYTGYPTAEHLQKTIEEFKEDLSKRPNNEVCYSGGIYLDWCGGSISVSIHTNLANSYFKTLNSLIQTE